MQIDILTKSCTVCEADFTKPINCSLKSWEIRSFCSKSCANSRTHREYSEPLPNITHGMNGYNLYGCRCDECREAIRQRKQLQRQGIKIPRELWGHKDETHPRWKGDAVGYKCIHDWVRRRKVKTGMCTHCLKDKGTASGHATQWANIDHAYRRNIDDYIELCPSCHKKYDLQYNRGIRIKK